MPDFTDRIRQEVARNNYIVSHHAIVRMGLRQVLEEEVIQTILDGEVIERLPRAKPYPKCLFMYPVRPDEPLYVSCGFDGRRAYIITAHWFDPEKWIDWRTRRRR